MLYRDARSKAEKLRDQQVKNLVLRGMELLQEKWGEGWVEHMNPVELELSDGSACVLGQLYGDYEDGLEELGLDNGRSHGFIETSSVSYEDLQEAWVEVLTV